MDVSLLRDFYAFVHNLLVGSFEAMFLIFTLALLLSIPKFNIDDIFSVSSIIFSIISLMAYMFFYHHLYYKINAENVDKLYLFEMFGPMVERLNYKILKKNEQIFSRQTYL